MGDIARESREQRLTLSVSKSVASRPRRRDFRADRRAKAGANYIQGWSLSEIAAEMAPYTFETRAEALEAAGLLE